MAAHITWVMLIWLLLFGKDAKADLFTTSLYPGMLLQKISLFPFAYHQSHIRVAAASNFSPTTDYALTLSTHKYIYVVNLAVQVETCDNACSISDHIQISFQEYLSPRRQLQHLYVLEYSMRLGRACLLLDFAAPCSVTGDQSLSLRYSAQPLYPTQFTQMEKPSRCDPWLVQLSFAPSLIKETLHISGSNLIGCFMTSTVF